MLVSGVGTGGGSLKKSHGQSDKFDVCRGEGQEDFSLSRKLEQERTLLTNRQVNVQSCLLIIF